MYYVPPLSNIFQIEQNLKKCDILLTIFHYNNHNTRYFHTFQLYFQCHKHTTSQEKDFLETLILNTISNSRSNTLSFAPSRDI